LDRILGEADRMENRSIYGLLLGPYSGARTDRSGWVLDMRQKEAVFERPFARFTIPKGMAFHAPSAGRFLGHLEGLQMACEGPPPALIPRPLQALGWGIAKPRKSPRFTPSIGPPEPRLLLNVLELLLNPTGNYSVF
jgi:hypothetical protein